VTLPEELRKRAHELDVEPLPACPDFGGAIRERAGLVTGLLRAADLVEADPLYQAMPRLLAMARGLHDARKHDDWPYPEGVENEKFLATFPTATPPALPYRYTCPFVGCTVRHFDSNQRAGGRCPKCDTEGVFVGSLPKEG
jgi:hypothetical protein